MHLAGYSLIGVHSVFETGISRLTCADSEDVTAVRDTQQLGVFDVKIYESTLKDGQSILGGSEKYLFRYYSLMVEISKKAGAH
jgi:hypothetical protein